MTKPLVENHKGVLVVRDDLFPGGTKARFIPLLFNGVRRKRTSPDDHGMSVLCQRQTYPRPSRLRSLALWRFSLMLMSLRKPRFPQTRKKPLAVRRAAERSDQSRVSQCQPGQQTHKARECCLRLTHSSKMTRRCGQCRIRVWEIRIELDRLIGATASAKRSACRCDHALTVCQITIR